jgi:kynurenine formamidase
MLIDVTQPIFTGMPKARTLPEVRVEPMLCRSRGDALDTSLLTIPSHAGTHVDAPSHRVLGGATIDQLDVARFTGPAVVATVHRAPGELITVSDVQNGGPPVQRGDMLLLDTGWAGHFGSEQYYDHPSLDPELASWLVEAGVTMVAADLATPDLAIPRRQEGFDFPVHDILLGNDVLIAENLAGLERAAGRRVVVHAFPLVVRGGDAGHVRMVVDLGE